MNEIRIFENENFGSVRTVEIEGEPWFVGRDIALALGYARPENAVKTHVEDDDKTTTLIQGSGSNYKSKVIIVNESGLYALIFGSQLSGAKEFKHWVTSEVLPSIRRTGSYSMDIPQDYPSALRALADKCEENQRLEAKIALDAPKTRFADCVADSPELSYVSELAKVLKQNGVNIGRTRVFEWLREHEYIMKTGSKYNEPTQKAMNRKLFHVVKDRFGNAITKMTQKGFIVLLNEIMDDYTGQNQMAII